jgi:hypothetical protein
MPSIFPAPRRETRHEYWRPSGHAELLHPGEHAPVAGKRGGISRLSSWTPSASRATATGTSLCVTTPIATVQSMT